MLKQKLYKCDLCVYRTTSSRNLKRHKLKHSGEKPYKCDVCDYSTIWSRALKTHKLMHSGEKPYKCVYVTIVQDSMDISKVIS